MICNRLAATLLALAAASPAFSATALATGPVPSTRSIGQATTTPADAARQAKVDTLLKVSGISAQLDILSDEMVTALAGPAAQDSKVSDAKVQMEALARKAFPAERFTQVARESLLKHYDATVYDRYIARMNEPLARRFTEMESFQIKPGPLSEYLKGLQVNPMAASRMKLIEAIDEEGHTSLHRVELVTSIAETMAIASLGACPTKGQIAQVKDGLAKMKDPIKKQHEGYARITLAYTYRSATDTELAYLLKAMHEGMHQSVNKWVWDAIEHEMKAGFAVVADAVRAMAVASSRQQTVFAQRSCEGKSLLPPPGYAKSIVPRTMRAPSLPTLADQPKAASEGLARQALAAPPTKVTVVAVAPADSSVQATATPAVVRDQAPKPVKLWRSRANVDARECLEYEDMKKVMACAERFR